MPLTVVHLAPHPDDEVLGAGATLLRLRGAGHRVVNVACGLGSAPEHRERRRDELVEACARAGFELVVADDPAAALRALAPDLVVAPGPEDAHPAHERVGRLALDHVGALGDAAPVLWQWGLWADLPRPTLYAPFGRDDLERLRDVLAAHAGEVARNDYDALVEARGVIGRVLGSERVFGFGAPARPGPYADVLRELLPGGRPGDPRTLDVQAPLT